jgi:uncharacterized protein YqfA (UPF0365 family)
MNMTHLALIDFGTIILIVIVIVGLLLLGIMVSFLSVWLRAWLAGAYVGFTELIAMRLRQVPYGMVVDARITAKKAGISIPIDQIVVEAVRTSVDPKVIDCPNPASGRTTIDGVAKDGIQVKVRARVTVRTNLDRFVGGAKEETIIARVGEGIVTTIGSAESYKTVLESPDSISKVVLHRGLDVGTAFEILSIDIADVDVGENVGAQLQEAQAEANKNMAQAQAEIRRAAAVALEQEMVARVAEMKAKVVEAEAQVPLAMAEAFRNGHLGVMDYYRMENIKSDTQMRSNISKEQQ